MAKPGPNRAWQVALSLFVGACGGASGGGAVEPQGDPETSGSEQEGPSPDALSVSGLLGTLSQDEIRGALEPRMPKFSRCAQKRSSEVEWLSGSMNFQFHVALDGRVSSVFPRESTMGDRDTERCMLDIAKGTRFPAPHGGEAEFAWSLEVPLDEEVRPPVDLPPEQTSELVATRASEVTSACGAVGYAVTAYVDPEGHVVAAGAAPADEAGLEHLDCVTDAVKGWTFPSPGSYAAKVQFQIQ